MERKIMNKSDKAAQIFKDGYNCAQAVFSAFSGELGLSEEDAKRVAAAFGGGMGRKGYVCGAVTGALMVLGIKNGGKKEDKEKNYADTVRFWDKFTENHGSVICLKLLECNLATPEGLQAFKEKNLHEKICAKLVKDAAEILEKDFIK